MTISKAKKEWKLSDEKILAILENGLIRDIKIIDGKVCLPDHKNIKIPKNNQKITVEYVVKSILEMCNELGYIDNRLLEISENDFENIIKTMENDGLIYKSTDQYPAYTNLNYTISNDGRNKLKKNSFKLKQISFGFNVKVFSLNANIERE